MIISPHVYKISKKKTNLFKNGFQLCFADFNSQAIYPPWYRKKENFIERDSVRKDVMKWEQMA